MIVFLGMLPPPLHGFSKINSNMLCELQKETQVVVYDSARFISVSFILNLIWVLRCFVFFFGLLVFDKPKSLYVGLCGGYRQLIDISYVCVALMFGLPVYVHHHSFAYINKKNFFASLLFRLPINHIVLCEEMRNRICKLYKVNGKCRFMVLSNAAFVSFDESVVDIESDAKTVKESDGITIGFISNITKDKGIFEFFEFVEKLLGMKLLDGISILIAGPVDPLIKRDFVSWLERIPNAQHLGPVYGQEKDKFFKNIDVLCFPTNYKNEAEPVVVLEGMVNSAVIFSTNRGCIPCMLRFGGGYVYEYDSFIEEALSFFKSPDFFDNLMRDKRMAHLSFHVLREEARQNLSTIVHSIVSEK